jgi:hypothetical protein
MDRAAAIVHGRHSHEGGPRAERRTVHVPVFDIDILDANGARVVEEVILHRLGDKGALLIRIGLAPSRRERHR